MIIKILLTMFLFVSMAYAHPGRLNSDGCHFVRKEWVYKSGVVLKKGTYHCHRGIDKMKLDGFEILEDPKDPGCEVGEKEKGK